VTKLGPYKNQSYNFGLHIISLELQNMNYIIITHISLGYI